MDNIYVLSKNISLLNLLSEMEEIKFTVIEEFENISDEETSLFIMDLTEGNYSLLDRLCNYIEHAHCKMIIITDDTNNIPHNIKRQVAHIVSQQQYNLLKNLIYEVIADGQKTNVHVFAAADSKVGSTLVVSSICKYVSTHTQEDYRILYLKLDGNSILPYFKLQNEFCIDDLKNRIMTNLYREDEVFDTCTCINKHLYILNGSKNILDRQVYTPAKIKYFIYKLGQTFDQVFIDAGANFESGAFIGSLESTQNRYLITTLHRNAYSNFSKINEQIFNKLNISFKTLIINKFSDNIYESKNALAKIYDISQLFTINKDDNDLFYEYEGETLYREENHKDIIDQIEVISKALINKGDFIQSKSTKKKSKKMFYRLSQLWSI